MNNPTLPYPRSNKFFTLFTPLYWIAVFSALFLWSRKWTVVQATSTSMEHLFGLFGFCAFCVILYFFHSQFRSQPVRSLRSLILIGLPILISLLFLALTVEMSHKSWDYEQYETAFRAMAVNENPYLSTRYLYPPFFAQIMVFVYQVGRWIFPLLGLPLEESSLWTYVFYIHQSALYYALLLAYELSLRFAKRTGLSPLKAMLFVSILFLFNVPLLRTLSFNQVNFYVLDSILITLLALESFPIVSGLAIAFGGLIKLYPLAFTAPLLLTKKWRVLVGVLIGLAGVILFQTRLLRHTTLWKQFILFYMSFPVERESSWFRNSSPLSLLRNLIDFPGLPSSLVTPAFALVFLGIVIWYAIRFFQREKIYRTANSQTVTPAIDRESYRNFGHLIDFSVLSLLIAPSAWEHHYVIVIPLAIWAFALRGRDSFWLVTTALTMVFFMPVFNIFPFSYLRLFGLILLLVLVSPKPEQIPAATQRTEINPAR